MKAIAQLSSRIFINLIKTVSRKARKERKVKTGGYPNHVISLIGVVRYLYKYLNFFVTTAPLREQLFFLRINN